MVETQLYVGEWPIGKNNFPAPGKFPYKHEDLDYEVYDAYSVPLPPIVGEDPTFYVAAHATVCCPEERDINNEEEYYCEGEYADVTLLAGQTIESGWVTVSVKGDSLIVEYFTIDGWELMETHLYVGNGKPDKHSPGKFPYKHEDLGGVTWDEYVIPLEDVISDEDWGADVDLCFAAHGVVRKLIGYEEDGTPIYQEETAWGEGERITKKKKGGPWAMYFCTTIEWGDCGPPDDPGDDDCETVWAYGNFDFQDYGIERWGWWFDVPFSGWD